MFKTRYEAINVSGKKNGHHIIYKTSLSLEGCKFAI